MDMNKLRKETLSSIEDGLTFLRLMIHVPSHQKILIFSETKEGERETLFAGKMYELKDIKFNLHHVIVVEACGDILAMRVAE